MAAAGFESAFPVSDGPQTHALRPHGHWDRLLLLLMMIIMILIIIP
jgi:hypothetical protein